MVNFIKNKKFKINTNKKNKKFRLFLICIISGIIVSSCDYDSFNDNQELYTYEFESVELIGKEYQSKISKKASKITNEKLILSSSLKMNIEIPQEILNSKNLELFKKFINNNRQNLEGELTFYFNGIADKTFDLCENNKYKTSIEIDDSYPRRNECSYEGVRQCTQYKIYQGMNTLEKLFCAYAGLGCIGQQAASCTSRNCFGDVAPNEK